MSGAVETYSRRDGGVKAGPLQYAPELGPVAARESLCSAAAGHGARPSVLYSVAHEGPARG